MKNMNKAVLVLGISALAVNVASANNNTLGGTDNTITASSHSSAVFGYQNTIDANNAIAFGENNVASGTNSFVGGNNSKATGRNTFAYGSHAEALVEYTTAIGSQARTSAYNTVAIGNGAYVSGESSVVLGRTNNVTGENTVVVGANNNNVAGGQSAIIGYNNTIGADKEQLVFGSNSESNGQGTLVFGTHSKSLATDAVAFGNNTLSDRANSVAIGTNSVTDDAVGVDGITINGTRHVFAGEQPTSVVSFGSRERAGAGGVKYYNRQLQNISAGRIEADSLDAINGSQLYAIVDEVETNAKQIAKNKNNIKDIAVGLNMLGDVVNDHDQQLTNHETRITDLEHRTYNLTQEINNKVNNLGQRVNKLGASSAALAGLHPLDFNRNDKASYAVSYGHYRNANAVALGAFYRPNERTMFGIGASLGGETQFTMNVAFKVGKGSDYIQEAKDKDSRISKLEAMVQKLMAEVEQQKAVK